MLKMKLQEVHQLIPFRKLFKLVFGFALSIQLIIISANHISGYYVLTGIEEFLLRFLFGSSLSIVATFIAVYPDLLTVRALNDRFGWHKNVFLRILIQFFIAVFLGAAAAILITSVSHFFRPYRDGLSINAVYNVLIFAVCNVILMIILEGWIFFIEGVDSRRKSKALQEQVSQLRFEVLKQQIDSHFMFNSLNVLSGLINKDQEKAQQFIDEFSNVYRYVLQSIEKPVVRLSQEIRFARSYLALQQMRYGPFLQYHIDMPSELLDAYIPPLTLQVVLENICKHNLISDSQPLIIDITGTDYQLIVRNNLQPKISSDEKSGSGQANLIKRYSLLGSDLPEFKVGTSHYIATLPLIYEDY